MTYFCGATLGKKALKIKVIKQNREKLSLVDVIYRESIGRYLSGLIIFIGYIMIAVDSKKRGLHDILCDTFVIYNFDNELNINNVCGNLEVQQTEIKPELASEELLNSDNNEKMKNKFKNIQIIYDLDVFLFHKFLLIIQENKK